MEDRLIVPDIMPDIIYKINALYQAVNIILVKLKQNNVPVFMPV